MFKNYKKNYKKLKKITKNWCYTMAIDSMLYSSRLTMESNCSRAINRRIKALERTVTTNSGQSSVVWRAWERPAVDSVYQMVAQIIPQFFLFFFFLISLLLLLLFKKKKNFGFFGFFYKKMVEKNSQFIGR